MDKFHSFFQFIVHLNGTTITLIAMIITTVATVTLAELTRRYVNLLSRQTDPCVVLRVVPDYTRPSIIQLEVRNIGYGLAEDIKFEFSNPIPEKAYGMNPDNVEKPGDMKNGPLINGIPFLVSNEFRRIDWGQYHGLKSALGDKKIIVTCRFKKGKKEMRPTILQIEIESFANCAIPETIDLKIVNILDLIATQLKRINKTD